MIGGPIGSYTSVTNGNISGTSFPFKQVTTGKGASTYITDPSVVKVPTNPKTPSVSSSKPSTGKASTVKVSTPSVSAGSAGSAFDLSAILNYGADQIAAMKDIAQANSAASAEQARIQREWQEVQNAKAMEFNAQEAAKNRDWQEMMSNTAHQREVNDLMAAGLNPVLSAMNGNGAAVGSGATASGVTSAGAKGEVDTSASGAIVNLLGSILAAQTQIQAANINARTQEAVADKYTAMEGIVASIAASASRYATDKGYDIGRSQIKQGYFNSAMDLIGSVVPGLILKGKGVGKIGFGNR